MNDKTKMILVKHGENRLKIFVDAYMAYNLGDDLFLHILSDAFKNVDFYLNCYGSDYATLFNSRDNLHKEKYSFFLKVLNRLEVYDYINDTERLARNFDAYLFLGGSIFREESWWQGVYAQRLKIVESFSNKSKPVFILGANFGPYDSLDFLYKHRHMFSKCTDICFRDVASYTLFKDMPNVRHESDIVFQYSVPPKGKEKKAAVSVINPEHIPGLNCKEQYVGWLIDAIKDLQNMGYEVHVASFCQREGDLSICKSVQETFDDKDKPRIWDYSYNNLDEIVDLFAESEIIIASRFHANILGLLCGARLIPVVYSEKTSNVLSDVGFKGEIFTINECSNIDLKELLSGTDYQGDIDFSKLITSAQKQFSVLNDWIKQNG